MALYGVAAAALLFCAAALVYRAQARRHRELARREHEEAGHLVTATEWFADEAVPGLLAAVRKGASVESALASVAPSASPAYRRVLRQVAEEAARSEKRRAAAMAACANAAGRMQAISTGMLADLREMEHRHGDEDVLADLLHLDHRTAQAGRLADSIAVLSGARSGRRWAKPIQMESVLRGAIGRTAGYQRVRLHSVADLAVAGHAAEGVMHVLAELFDNACNFSPPSTDVHGYVAEVPAGAVITIEDSGLMMSETALRRAERAVSGESGDLSELTGTRLGLAVVGRLAKKHGLRISYRPSATGGTGVVVMIPTELITRARPDDPRARPARPAPARHTATDSWESRPARRHTTEAETRTETRTEDRAAGTGLPKRRRGRTLAASHPRGLPATDTTRQQPEPAAPGTRHGADADAGARFRAFRRAVTGQDQQGGDPDRGTSAAPTEPSRTEDDS
ncbi:sensor histidine kinase [Streptomyces sp. NPDC088387]|uniref:sensor histidine kinase n=1 Tax=Streptomyces sp. NPDC088387 TaxID=3365859 RepID=UPI0037FD52CA